MRSMASVPGHVLLHGSTQRLLGSAAQPIHLVQNNHCTNTTHKSLHHRGDHEKERPLKGYLWCPCDLISFVSLLSFSLLSLLSPSAEPLMLPLPAPFVSRPTCTACVCASSLMISCTTSLSWLPGNGTQNRQRPSNRQRSQTQTIMSTESTGVPTSDGFIST